MATADALPPLAAPSVPVERVFESGNPAVVGGVYIVRGLSHPDLVDRRVDIWVPPGYDTDVSKRYPVLYMHDGQNVFDPQYSKYSGEEWGVDEAIAKLAADEEIDAPIVVGIWSVDDTRFFDLMPQKAVTPEAAKGFGGDGEDLPLEMLRGDAYLAYVTDVVKPYVDMTFRTKPDQVNTFVMGSSMGGLMSCYAIAERPDVFGAAACVSTHWPIGEGIAVDYFIDNIPSPEDHRIYFDFGTETLDAGYEPFQRQVDAAMAARGYVEGDNWVTVKADGADHSEVAWRARIDHPLRFLVGQN